MKTLTYVLGLMAVAAPAVFAFDGVPTTVPDGGSTFLLLAASLSAFGAVRGFFSRSK